MKFAEHYLFLKRASYADLLRLCVVAAATVMAVCIGSRSLEVEAAGAQEAAQVNPGTVKSPPALGTIKSISGNTLVLTSDAGVETTVDVRDSTKIVRIAPGQTDLKNAQAIVLTDLQVGDRILVRGKAGRRL